MEKYSDSSIKIMQLHYSNLPECLRRHYAAVEARKLGYGGINYISKVLKIDRKTIRRGIKELEDSSVPLLSGRQRKAGGGRKKNSSRE